MLMEQMYPRERGSYVCISFKSRVGIPRFQCKDMLIACQARLTCGNFYCTEQVWRAIRGMGQSARGGKWVADRGLGGKEVFVPDDVPMVGTARS